MIEGTVRFFNDAYGFGFIQTDEEKEVFVHHSDIQAEGYKTLRDGERLRFNIVKGFPEHGQERSDYTGES